MGRHCAVAVVTLCVGGPAVRRVHAIRGDGGTVERRQNDVRVACGVQTQAELLTCLLHNFNLPVDRIPQIFCYISETFYKQ